MAAPELAPCVVAASGLGHEHRGDAAARGERGALSRPSCLPPIVPVLLLAVATLAAAPASEPPSVSAAAVAGAPLELDGRLDEPAWATAGVLTDLIQQAPEPGAPTPYRTEVRVLHDADRLYFGIVCTDPDPAGIAVHTLERDGDMSGDDSVAIVLDTFGDQRTGYLFRVNPAGARQDGLIAGAESVSLDWDGIWDARAVRGPEGWSAEIVIPSRTLRFDPESRAWGLNVERFVARDRLTLRWTGGTLDAQLSDLRRAGRFSPGPLSQGLGLSLAPYGLARRSEAFASDDTSLTGEVGLDVTYSFTPELSGILTVNTDFAETEVDSRRINLTRFPLFFPEKRAFFLDGSNQFAFATGLGESFVPFFSRRVGLFAGEVVPIDAGVKVIGRAGRWGIGALDVYTGEIPEASGTNLFAGRVTYDASERLRLGTLVTDGSPDGVSENTLAALDAVWQTASFRGDKNLALSGWYAGSRGDLPDGRPTGWGFKADYPNDLWDLSAQVRDFGAGLDPALGFLPRPGTRQYEAGGAFQPRPQGGPFDWVRQFFFELFAERVDDLHGDPESWQIFTAPFNARTESGEHLEANWVRQFERLDAPFEVSEGVIIPPGRYTYDRYRIEAQSSSHRPWGAGATVWFGGFFSGRLTEWSPYVSWAARSGRVRLQLEGTYITGTLPEGDFIERLGLLQGVYAFSPYLVASANFQYDSISRALGMNTRLRWTLHPGTDLYVVWNRSWQEPPADGSISLHPEADQLAVKLRWTFQP